VLYKRTIYVLNAPLTVKLQYTYKTYTCFEKERSGTIQMRKSYGTGRVRIMNNGALGYLCEKFLESPEGVLLLLVGHPAGGAHVKQVQDCGLHLKQSSLLLSTRNYIIIQLK
jgi:hypothetical protein